MPYKIHSTTFIHSYKINETIFLDFKSNAPVRQIKKFVDLSGIVCWYELASFFLERLNLYSKTDHFVVHFMNKRTTAVLERG